MSIRIGILGYGNLGKGVESAIGQNPDLELTAVFTRRNPENVNVRTAGVKVLAASAVRRATGSRLPIGARIYTRTLRSALMRRPLGAIR